MTQDLENLWAQLKPDERRCVAAYQLLRVKADAAREIGRTPKWLENRERRHPAFREAMDSKEWTSAQLNRISSYRPYIRA